MRWCRRADILGNRTEEWVKEKERKELKAKTVSV